MGGTSFVAEPATLLSPAALTGGMIRFHKGNTLVEIAERNTDLERGKVEGGIKVT